MAEVTKKSWKTTAGAWIGGGVMILGELCDLLGVSVQNVTNGTFEAQVVLAGLALFGIGWFARDKDVSSEDQGIK